MDFEIAKKAHWNVSVFVTLFSGLFLVLIARAGDEPMRLLSMDSPVVVELGTVVVNSQVEFAFNVQNDLKQPWHLQNVSKSCTCQNIEVSDVGLIGGQIVGKGILTISNKRDIGPFEHSIRVNGHPKGFDLKLRGIAEKTLTITPANFRVPEGISRVDFRVKSSNLHRIKYLRIQDREVVLKSDGDSQIATFDFDTSIFDPTTLTVTQVVQAYDSNSSIIPYSEEQIGFQLIDRTQSTPKVVEIHQNRITKVSIMVTSGEPDWFNSGLKIYLRHENNRLEETKDFRTRRIKPNTAALVLEIPSSSKDKPESIVLMNDVKNWTFSVPITVSR